MPGKLLIISGPSGSGKTTITHHLLEKFSDLAFSVSATTRSKRPQESDGKDYFFLSEKEFRQKISSGEFAEWEEVYPGMFYGTLKMEIERNWALGKTLVFDVDVRGALNLKNRYPDNSLAVIILPPSKEDLKNRLTKRETETDIVLERRLAKAEKEMSMAEFFDVQLINDTLEHSFEKAEKIAEEFLGR